MIRRELTYVEESGPIPRIHTTWSRKGVGHRGNRDQGTSGKV